MKAEIAYAFWPPITSDQWFLPKFKLRIKNLGTEIRRGSVAVEIADADQLKSLAEITSSQILFQDVLHCELNSLEPGAVYRRTIRIDSRFLKPGRFIIRLVLNEWIPSDSPIAELRAQLATAAMPLERIQQLENTTVQFLTQQGINPHEKPAGQFKGKRLFDLRFTEIIKVHSLGIVTGILVALSGAAIAAVRLIVSNWDSIRSLLRLS